MIQPTDHRGPGDYKAEIQKLRLTNPVISAAMKVHANEGTTYEQALECMVVILAEQNAHLLDECVKLRSGAPTVIHIGGKERLYAPLKGGDRNP